MRRYANARVANHDHAPVLIQTKTGVTADGPNLAPERVRRQLEKSRETLGRVDLFLAHAVDFNTIGLRACPCSATRWTAA